MEVDMRGAENDEPEMSFPQAQQRSGCSACVSAAACDGKHDSCVAECRARLFSIDPKRATCIAECESKATQCLHAATPRRQLMPLTRRADQPRSGRKKARMSSASSSGCSIAAKWPPHGITVQRRILV